MKKKTQKIFYLEKSPFIFKKLLSSSTLLIFGTLIVI